MWPFGSLERGAYSLLCVDPPWRFTPYSRETGLKKSADAHYGTMELPDIMALPVSELAAPDALLWLWATWPMLDHARQVMDAWDFTYKSGGVWHKKTKHGKTQFGTGYIFRSACEPFLVGTRGKPKTSRSVRNVVEAKVREHSRKPEEAYAAMELLIPDATRVELFSRQSRPGWASWGMEVGKFDDVSKMVHYLNDPQAQ